MDAINSYGKGRKDTADNKISKDTGNLFNNIKNFFTNLFNTKPADKKFNDTSPTTAETFFSKKGIQLNPADIKIDESLPSYPITSVSFKSVSDELAEKAFEERAKARSKVRSLLDAILKEQRTVKDDIQQKWDTMSDEDRIKSQDILDTYNKNKQYLDLVNNIKTELVWWDNNIKLSPIDVKTRTTQFEETILNKHLSLQNNLISRAKTIIQNTIGVTKQVEDKMKKILERTLTDDVYDSVIIAGQIALWIIYFYIAFRCASYAANEKIYKPVAYRVLVFIYVFILAPIFAPYYIFRLIKSYIWPTEKLPLVEGFLPFIPYKPTDEMTWRLRIFGYELSPRLEEIIRVAQEKERKERDDTVISKNLKKKIIESNLGVAYEEKRKKDEEQQRIQQNTRGYQGDAGYIQQAAEAASAAARPGFSQQFAPIPPPAPSGPSAPPAFAQQYPATGPSAPPAFAQQYPATGPSLTPGFAQQYPATGPSLTPGFAQQYPATGPSLTPGFAQQYLPNVQPPPHLYPVGPPPQQEQKNKDPSYPSLYGARFK